MRDGRWSDNKTLIEYGDGDTAYGVSKLAFDDRGHVYFTLSAAEHPGQDPADLDAEMAKAQDLASYRGKVFRIEEDGRIPADNPFVGKAGALPAIWSYGHRGLSGLTFDRARGELWATEHGPWGGDELNLIRGGANYGWPLVSFGYHYVGKHIDVAQAPALQSPTFHWTPSIGVSNVLVYDGAAFPKWRGQLFVGSLGSRIGRSLYRFELKDTAARLYEYPSDAHGRVLRDAAGTAQPRVPRYEEVLPDIGRIRDMRVGPEGYFYLLLERPERIVRVVPDAACYAALTRLEAAPDLPGAAIVGMMRGREKRQGAQDTMEISNRDYVNSLARGLEVIRAFTRSTPRMTLSDMARATGMTRATVRRFLLTLVREGYAVTDGKHFALKPRVLELGYSALSSLPFLDVVQPVMTNLAVELEESCFAAILDGEDVMYIATATPPGRLVNIDLSVGSRAPAHTVSTGRVLLAALDEKQRLAYLAKATLKKYTVNTVTSKVKLRTLIEETRTKGWAIVDQELEIGLRSISVPIRDHAGKVLAALNVACPSSRIPPEEMGGRILLRLQAAAQEITAGLQK